MENKKKPSIANIQGIQDNSQWVKDSPRMHFFKGALGFLGGLFIHLIIASLYQWGIINIYVTSQFKSTTQPNITLQDNAIVFPVMMISIGLTMRLGLFLAKKFGAIVILYLMNVLCAAMVFISSFLHVFICNSLLIFRVYIDLWYNFLIICRSNFYDFNCTMQQIFSWKKNVCQWFYSCWNRLRIIGVWSFFLQFYQSRDQLMDVTGRVPQCLRYLSLLYLIIETLGTSMLIPVYSYNVQYAKTHPVIDIGQNDAQSICQGIKSWLFWRKVFVLILATCGAFLVNGNYKTYVKQTITDDGFLTLVGTVGAIENGCSRFFWNLLFKKTGYKFVMLLNISLCISVLFSIRFITENQNIYLLLVFIMNCCLGGYLVITPTFAQLAFGPEVRSNIYVFFWEIYSTANFLQYLFVSTLVDSIGFNNIKYICIGMCFLAIPLVVCGKWQDPWENKTAQLQYCVHIQNNKIQNQDEKQEQNKKMIILKFQKILKIHQNQQIKEDQLN